MKTITQEYKVAVTAFALAAGLIATGTLAYAKFKPFDILKAGGIVLLVNQFGDDINKAINTVLLNKKIEVKDATKVVPIVSIGQGLIAGAAQVTGPANLVKQVKAVAQIEAAFGKVRIKYLWPIKSKNYSADETARVPGVGISALLAARTSKIF